MAKVEVSFALILCFLSLCSLVSPPAALAAPLKDAPKKDGDGFKTLGKKAGLVRHLCNETGHYNLCVAAVEADPRSNLKSHRKGILHIVMDKTISNATAILEYIDRLLADNTTKMENTTRNSLEGCSSDYHDSIYDLKHALSLLELKNVSQYSEMESMLNSMFTTPFDCDQDFIQRTIPAPNPLTGSINNCVQDLAETCMAILNHFWSMFAFNCLSSLALARKTYNRNALTSIA
ncbi:pectinesterase inhibitor 28-like [Rhododendron vialii]|uniref:pectinesterase inhibitor 28-like n=1 Tax=Rhododendron vialii TaxID=182163 RepID=UPI00265E48B2|nr:pectinesterase inhibitor 28-like [Rhododendron vialii]